MKKFKVKNRPKRRYIRRTTRTSYASFSVSRAALMGLLPACVAITFLATSIMATNPFNKAVIPAIHFTLPTLSIPAFPHYSFSLPDISFPTLSFPSLPSFQLPKLTIAFHPKPIQITAPEIDFSPAISLATQIILANKYLSATVIKESVSLFYKIISIEKFLLLNFYQTFLNLSQFYLNELLTIGNGVIVTSIWIGTFLITVGQYLVWIIQAIGHKIGIIFSTIISWIEKPFLVLGYYYKKIEPYLIDLGDHAKQAIHEMSGGVNSINTVTSEFLGNAKR